MRSISGAFLDIPHSLRIPAKEVPIRNLKLLKNNDIYNKNA